MSDQLLRTTAAAQRAKCSAETIRVAARTGKLPAAIVSEDGLRLFRPKDIDRFALEREKQRQHKAASAMKN